MTNFELPPNEATILEIGRAAIGAACDMLLENWIDPPPYAAAVVELLKTSVDRDFEEWSARVLGETPRDRFELSADPLKGKPR